MFLFLKVLLASLSYEIILLYSNGLFDFGVGFSFFCCLVGYFYSSCVFSLGEMFHLWKGGRGSGWAGARGGGGRGGRVTISD